MSALENDPGLEEGRGARRLTLVMGVLGGAALMALMLVTVVDVVGRNIIDVTVIGAYELSELAVGLIVAAGLPLVALRSDHVHIDMALPLLKGWLRSLQQPVALFATALAEGIVAWQVWVQAELATDTQRTTSMLHLPVSPVLYITAILFGVSALLTTVHALRKIAARGEASEGSAT
ncbi:TRAP transporter small permease [Pusillimonas noertemannii]|uniref:TRAP transporter small permease protein n=1 Tax=Pusillimonas noertemannii TaxID=305977 RepID=A0A2U1CNE9_9BURK|nr:TRAP transporter small permease [Pusillimonas noertemannii]NYT68444.1 TRAP transporter small permease [Pusillimonas noertemannii]PVY62539.1 TRAP-type C4-dicarboxylate transport system permease small subunit [Pusillimonas noertemannii]TFL10509.1 TRAP transporter small permease [Pusillimonas noertemannii]